MGVTPNCHAALQRLRKTDSPRTLWIDSICINQSLNAEKNHQLMLTSRIYQGATRVVVYLGEGTSDTDAAMKYIGDIDDPSDYGIGDATSRYLQSAICDSSSLDVFFKLPWFHRVWVLQEITFAKQAIVVCGSRELDLQNFHTFYQWNVTNQTVDTLPYSVQYATSPIPEHGDWISYVERLLEMLRDTRHCGATDPRDKLYAILPLLGRGHDQMSVQMDEAAEERDCDEDDMADMQTLQQKTRIPVDYACSETAVFTDLAVLLLQKVGPDILKSVVKKPQLPGLPSWVPDWTTSSSYWSSQNPPRDMEHAAGFDGESDYYFGRSRYKPERLRTWTASEYASSPRAMSTQLHLEVVRVGHITKLGDVCDIGNNVFPLAQWESLVPNKEYLQGKKTPRNLSSQEMGDWYHGPKGLSPFARTVSGDDVVYPNAVNHVVEFIKLYSAENMTNEEKEAQKRSAFWHERYDKDRIPLIEVFGMGSSYDRQASFIIRACDGKRFFVTHTGFIGLAPKQAQVGDVVYVVKGASVPFVFRCGPSKGADTSHAGRAEGEDETQCFELVGESFAFGVMAGSIWHDVANKTKKVEEIIVR